MVGTDAATYFALWRDLEAVCPNWAIDLREINQSSHFTDTVCQTGSSSMNPQAALLKASIDADLREVESLYARLANHVLATTTEQAILAGYYLHNLYNALTESPATSRSPIFQLCQLDFYPGQLLLYGL